MTRIRSLIIAVALAAGCGGSDVSEAHFGLAGDLPGCDQGIPPGRGVEQPLPAWGDGLSKLVVDGVEVCVDTPENVRALILNRGSSNPMPGTANSGAANSNPMPGTANSGAANSNPMPGTDPNAASSSNPMPGSGR